MISKKYISFLFIAIVFARATGMEGPSNSGKRRRENGKEKETEVPCPKRICDILLIDEDQVPLKKDILATLSDKIQQVKNNKQFRSRHEELVRILQEIKAILPAIFMQESFQILLANFTRMPSGQNIQPRGYEEEEEYNPFLVQDALLEAILDAVEFARVQQSLIDVDHHTNQVNDPQARLTRSILKNNISQIQQALEDGARLDRSRGQRGYFPIHYAYNSTLEVLKFLVEKGARVDVCDSSGWQVIHHAVRKGNKAVVAFLLSQGVPVFAPINSEEHLQLIHIAARHNRAEIVALLLDNSIAVWDSDDNRWQAIYHAVYHQSIDVIKLLLTRGIAPFAALYLAIKYRRIECVRFLLNYDVALDTRNRRGEQLIHIAAKSGDVEIVRLLLQRGADPRSPLNDLERLQPLHIAAKYNHASILRLLVDEYGVNIHERDGQNRTALENAQLNKSKEAEDMISSHIESIQLRNSIPLVETVSGSQSRTANFEFAIAENNISLFEKLYSILLKDLKNSPKELKEEIEKLLYKTCTVNRTLFTLLIDKLIKLLDDLNNDDSKLLTINVSLILEYVRSSVPKSEQREIIDHLHILAAKQLAVLRLQTRNLLEVSNRQRSEFGLPPFQTTTLLSLNIHTLL